MQLPGQLTQLVRTQIFRSQLKDVRAALDQLPRDIFGVSERDVAEIENRVEAGAA